MRPGRRRKEGEKIGSTKTLFFLLLIMLFLNDENFDTMVMNRRRVASLERNYEVKHWPQPPDPSLPLSLSPSYNIQLCNQT